MKSFKGNRNVLVNIRATNGVAIVIPIHRIGSVVADRRQRKIILRDAQSAQLVDLAEFKDHTEAELAQKQIAEFAHFINRLLYRSSEYMSSAPTFTFTDV